jgi:hypothetical protein
MLADRTRQSLLARSFSRNRARHRCSINHVIKSCHFCSERRARLSITLHSIAASSGRRLVDRRRRSSTALSRGRRARQETELSDRQLRDDHIVRFIEAELARIDGRDVAACQRDLESCRSAVGTGFDRNNLSNGPAAQIDDPCGRQLSRVAELRRGFGAQKGRALRCSRRGKCNRCDGHCCERNGRCFWCSHGGFLSWKRCTMHRARDHPLPPPKRGTRQTRSPGPRPWQAQGIFLRAANFALSPP